MSTQIQRRRGTTAEHSTFTGVEGEITVDTTKDTAVVHDGTTVGGHPLQKQYPPLGSAAAPTYTFTGDTNTGIYSPGADQVAISTNGTQRLLIKDASQDTLRVSGVNAVVTADAIGSSFPGFRLASNGSILAGFDGDSGNSANLFTYAAVPLVFGIDSSERMRITSAGLVGIGTSAPNELLEVRGTENQGIRLTSTASSGEGANLQWYSEQSGDNKITAEIESDGSGTGGNLSFRTRSTAGILTDRVLIDNAGRLGVGTTSPTYLCNVIAAAGSQNIFQAGQTGVSNGYTITSNGTNLTHAWFNGGSEAARIDFSGRLGIGDSAPSNTFTLKAAAGLVNDSDLPSASALIKDSGSGRRLGLGTSSTGNWIQSSYPGVAGVAYPLLLNPFGGNVGIGTTSPAGILDIDVTGDQLVRFQTTAAMKTRLVTGNSDVSAIEFSDNAAYRAKIQAETSDAISFYTGGITTEAARLDSSGRLLVGTSSARGQLGITPGVQSEGTNFAQGTLALTVNSNSGAYPLISLARSGGTSLGSNTIVSNGDIVGKIFFTAADGVDMASAVATIEAVIDGTPGSDDLPGRLVFSTTADGASSTTERMRIASDGNVNVGGGGITARVSAASAATSTVVFYGYANTASYTTSVIQAQSETSAGTGWNLYIGYASGGNLVYRVYGNGNVQNTSNSYTAISDIKLKENIVDANSQWDDIKGLQVRNYNLKEGQTHRQIGLIAQEVEPISPGLVYESPDRDEEGNDLGTVTKSVNYSVLYMKAVKALQEAMERIETLEAAVTALQQP
jgi:hypothetical protein